VNVGSLLRSQQGFVCGDEPLSYFTGGIGSGKTRSLDLWGLKRGLAGRRVILTEPTYGMIADIMIPTMEGLLQEFEIESLCKFNKSGRPNLHLPNNGYIAFR